MNRFDMLFNNEDVDKDFLAQNSHLTTEQIDLLYSPRYRGVDKDYLAQYSKLTDEQFNRFLNNEDVDKDYLAFNPSITSPYQTNRTGIINWMW